MLQLIKNVPTLLPKIVLVPLRLATATLRPETSGSEMTTLIISSKEIKDIMKIVKPLKDSDRLIKGVTQSIENEKKNTQRGWFLSMLLGTLGASLLRNLLGKEVIRVCVGAQRAGEDFYCHLIIWLILKCKSFTKINLNLEMFIHEILYQKL